MKNYLSSKCTQTSIIGGKKGLSSVESFEIGLPSQESHVCNELIDSRYIELYD